MVCCPNTCNSLCIRLFVGSKEKHHNGKIVFTPFILQSGKNLINYSNDLDRSFVYWKHGILKSLDDFKSSPAFLEFSSSFVFNFIWSPKSCCDEMSNLHELLFQKSNSWYLTFCCCIHLRFYCTKTHFSHNSNS